MIDVGTVVTVTDERWSGLTGVVTEIKQGPQRRVHLDDDRTIIVSENNLTEVSDA